jgi:DNA-binding CsgD family transcriptional regulator
MALLERLCRISPAETRVLQLLLVGASNRAIAAQLRLSPRTVESHVSAMFEKTGCSNRSQLLLWGLRQRSDRGSMHLDTACSNGDGGVGVPGDSAQH